MRDGSTEEVTVLALPVRRYEDLFKVIDNEPVKIELCTGRPEGWADGLTPSSHVELLEVVEEMNSSDFFAWLRRRVKRQEQLVPGSAGELGKRLLAVSPNGSPIARSAAV